MDIRSPFVKELAQRIDIEQIPARRLMDLLDTTQRPNALELRRQIESGEITHIKLSDAPHFFPYDRKDLSSHTQRMKDVEEVLKIPTVDRPRKDHKNVCADRLLHEVVDKYVGRTEYNVAHAVARLRYGWTYHSANRELSRLPIKPSLSRKGTVALSDLQRLFDGHDRRMNKGGYTPRHLLKMARINDPPEAIGELSYSQLQDRINRCFELGRFDVPSRTLLRVPGHIGPFLGESQFRMVQSKGAHSLPQPERSTAWRRNNEAMLRILGVPELIDAYDKIDSAVDLETAKKIGSSFAKLSSEGKIPVDFRDSAQDNARVLGMIGDDLKKTHCLPELATLFSDAASFMRSTNVSAKEARWHNNIEVFLKKLGVSPNYPEYSNIRRRLNFSVFSNASKALSDLMHEGAVDPEFKLRPHSHAVALQSLGERLLKYSDYMTEVHASAIAGHLNQIAERKKREGRELSKSKPSPRNLKRTAKRRDLSN